MRNLLLREEEARSVAHVPLPFAVVAHHRLRRSTNRTRAEKELGMKAVAKCPTSACAATLFQASSKYLADFSDRLRQLQDAAVIGPLPWVQAKAVIESSPFWHAKLIQEGASELGYQDLVSRAPVHMKVHRIAYDMYVAAQHPINSIYNRILDVYKTQWCPQLFPLTKAAHLSHQSCAVLM